MTDQKLQTLARQAGVATSWTDYLHRRHAVSPDTLRAVLRAMDLPAASEGEIARSQQRLCDAGNAAHSPLVTARPSTCLHLGITGKHVRVTSEDGRNSDLPVSDGAVRAPDTPGYYTMALPDRTVTMAVAAARAWTIEDIAADRRIWGTAVQVYALRDSGTSGFGDFPALARFAAQAGRVGADAVMISPAHAPFAADPAHYSPYAPSNRLFLNPLFAGPGSAPAATEDAANEIDWHRQAGRRMVELRAAYDRFRQTPGPEQNAFTRFVAAGGERLISHARFEALDARFRADGHTDWRRWPHGFADSASAAAGSLDAVHNDIEFHLFLQFRADQALGTAQRATRDAGMKLGLIADLAVGMDPAGSHAWGHPRDVLTGLTIGAPPDLLAPAGQNWGITGFSPTSLVSSGFDAFIATLRAAMRHTGGVRIDHAMGLRQTWVIPDGMNASQGTYLRYPFDDLLRLIVLESIRHRAVVIAEDLGTVPPDFSKTLSDAGILGMRVLWFERAGSDAFKPPCGWDRNAVAMTTTHDLATVAGWWRGRDVAWRTKVNGGVIDADRDRPCDRNRLWTALRRAGCARGPVPEEDTPEAVVSGAVAYVAATPSPLAIVPAEDLLGLSEQPNLPGTIDQHPNWRRRLPQRNMFADRTVLERIAAINHARRRA